MSNTKKLQVLQQLAEGKPKSHICRDVGINIKTVQRWESDPEFAQELERRRQEILNADHQRHLNKLEAYRVECEVLGRSLLTTGRKLLDLLEQRLSSIDLEEIKPAHLGSLSRAAATALEVGSKLCGEALGVEKLLNSMEENEQ